MGLDGYKNLMSKQKSNRAKRVLTLSLVLLGVALVLGAVLRKKEIPTTVQKEKVNRRTLTELVVANGKIQPVVQVKISPEVSGEIIELPVKEGQQVKKGDLLVRIKPDNYRASRDSSLANYQYSLTSSNTSSSNLEKARLDFARCKQLHENQLVSDSDFDVAKTAYDIAVSALEGARQQVQMAQAALVKAEDDLSKTTIYAPLSGTVTKLNSQLGERVVGTAMMAGTEIMTVSDLNEMETLVDIGEMDIVLIELGQNARLEVDAFKDRKFKGVVTEIANSAKAAANGTSQDATKFEIKIRINEKEAFRPGMSVTAEIETRTHTNVLAVPYQSVTTRLPKPAKEQTNTLAQAANSAKSDSGEPKAKKKGGEPVKAVEVVFVIENGKAKMTPVKRGISDDEHMEIIDGLKEGQEVVSGGYKAIKELEDGKDVIIGQATTESRN